MSTPEIRTLHGANPHVLVQEHTPLRDTLTGFTGKCAGYCFYSTGEPQYLLQPPVGAKGEWQQGQWFDESRLALDEAAPAENETAAAE